MARPIRIQYPGAIYHAMSRGNARHRIFQDPFDYQHFQVCLEEIVLQFAWQLFAFVLMPNHVHLFFQTMEANLSQGMQRLLSGYSNWYAKRHRRPGHLLQGRFKGELIEDESYFCAVSRYIHLNPVRGKKPLVAAPHDWQWSSYPGYYHSEEPKPWVAYDRIYAAWQSSFGGVNPAANYREFVSAGFDHPPENPFLAAKHGWILGSDAFVDRVREQLKSPSYLDEVPLARPMVTLSIDVVFRLVTDHFDVSPAILGENRNLHLARGVAAWLARRHTTATRREIAGKLGLRHPDSLANLTRRIERQRATSVDLCRQLDILERALREMRCG